MKRTLSVVLTLLAVLAFFFGVWLIGKRIDPTLDLNTGALIRFVFVGIGMLLVLVLYLFTSKNKMWEVGTRQVVYMAIGAALFAIFSYLFNGTVFVVPSVSQVALRPAIAIPMFFGYAFGPVVGFFTGAIGNVFGDAISGFGLSPQWCVGNGLIGLVSGLVWLFADKKRSINVVLLVSAVLAGAVTVLYLLNPNVQNGFSGTPISKLAGLSVLIGLAIVLIVRFVFGKNVNVAAAVTWAMLGNIIGIGFAAISDIWINGYPPAVALVGEFLPAAGPNLIFAAILVPILVGAYVAVQKQTGR
jgi:LytS/YehU family sensor histidine kinase